MVDHDIVIVGGGPSGAATALFCAAQAPEAAARIAIVDKATFPRDKVCAGAIGRRAERALEAIGVAVQSPRVAIHGLSVAAADERLAARHHERIGCVVRRRSYDAALLAAAQERGIAVHQGTRLLQLRRRAGGLTLETSRGTITAQAIVGADGVGSVVRRELGIPKGPYHAQAIEVDTPWRPGDPEPDTLHFDLSDPSYPGYAWDFPTRVDGRLAVCRGIYQLTRGSGAERGPDVATVLADRLRRQGLDPADYPTRRFSERGLSLHQPTSMERALLVGEAAGIDPVLGEGIAQAILYGQVAGPFLAEAMRAGDWSMRGFRRRLRRSRVGFDLRVRGLATRAVYGRTRPWLERWITRSPALAEAGMAYFGGEHVPRPALWRALGDLAVAPVKGRGRG